MLELPNIVLEIHNIVLEFINKHEEDEKNYTGCSSCPDGDCEITQYHVPWYASKFSTITEIADYWRSRYKELRAQSIVFRDTFYDTTLPPEVVEAVAANLTIL